MQQLRVLCSLQFADVLLDPETNPGEGGCAAVAAAGDFCRF